ncbi:hypothetical protein M426DRAFT_181004 [Hypoxylon sp. CI-4A]|nr:hypothetical protein M426DRAFT_181004 [Hypoxylon sp. CI-4A]
MAECSPIQREIHNITYPRLRLDDHTLDGSLPAFQSLPEGDHFCSPPTANIGILDALPPELISVVLSQLDLRTITDFRHVNRQAAELVNSLPEYKAITTHARNALRGILSIGTGRWITCSTLYEKLCMSNCGQCGDFGGYLYLLTCKRVCFLCLSQDRLYLPLLPSHARRKFGLDRQTIEKLPRMRVIPGTYSPNEKKVTQSVLVDYESALRAGVELHGSLSAMHKYVSDMEVQKVQAYHVKLAAAQQSGSITRHTRQPLLADPIDGRSGNPFRFAAIVRVPWLNRALHEVEWGFHCIGCEKSSRPPLHYRRQFTTVSFHDHLRQCGNIQDRKHYLD